MMRKTLLLINITFYETTKLQLCSIVTILEGDHHTCLYWEKQCSSDKPGRSEKESAAFTNLVCAKSSAEKR